MVPPASDRISRAPSYSTTQMIKLLHLAYRAFTVFGQTFQTVLLAQQFLTLCRLMVASASQTDCSCCHERSAWYVCVSQPLIDIRLPTYPSKLTDGNLKGLGSSGFARHYCRNRCLLSLPRGNKMFQFPRLPLPSPIYSDKCHWTLLQ